MVERKPRRGPPVPSDIAPTRPVPLLQAQPVRWWRGAESGSDLAVTRPYLQRPSAGIRRAALPLLALIGVACGAGSAFIAVQRPVAVTGLFLRLANPVSPGVADETGAAAAAAMRPPEPPDPFGASAADCSPAAEAAEQLTKGAYPQALAAYRDLAKAHPDQRIYVAIAELIEARLAGKRARAGRGRRHLNPSPIPSPKPIPSTSTSTSTILSPSTSTILSPSPMPNPILTLTPIPEPASEP